MNNPKSGNFMKNRQSNSGISDLKRDLSIVEELNIHHKRICLYQSNKIEIINIAEIIRCESQSNYTLFHLKSQAPLISCKPLIEYDKILSQYQFIRVHQSHLVNFKYVKTFIKGDNSHLIMSDLSMVEVSRRKRNILLQHLMAL